MTARRILATVVCLSFMMVQGASAASPSDYRLMARADRLSLVQQRRLARLAKLARGQYASPILKTVLQNRAPHVELTPTRAPLTITAGLRVSVPAQTEPPVSTVSVSDSVEAYRVEVLRLVNVERENEGLDPLTFNPLLNDSAQLYAERMAQEHFFSHTDPDGNSSLDRIRATGYLRPPCDCAWQYATGENLGSGQATPADVVRAWMDSPGHRANILHDQFDELGVGYADGYWVQHFGGIRVR